MRRHSEWIRALQLDRLRHQVAYVYERVAWYRDQMDERGVKPEDIRDPPGRAPASLHRQEGHARHLSCFGLFAIPVDDAVRLHASSGTTGKPVVVGCSTHDMDVWSECIARLATMAGVTGRDRAPDGVWLRHVHRRLRPAPGPRAPGMPRDPRRRRVHRAPHHDDRRLPDHRAHRHAHLRHAHLRGGGEDRLRLGE